nr:hypothetical protein [Pseudoalteromonas ostreae]
MMQIKMLLLWIKRYVDFDKSRYSAKLSSGNVLVKEKDHVFTQHVSRKNLPLEHVKVELNHTRDYHADCDNCEQTDKLEAITRKIPLVGDLSDAQRQRLLEIADKCPAHKILHNTNRVKLLTIYSDR